MLQADDNIINYVSAIFNFLEKSKSLGPDERELFKALLRDSTFLGPTTKELITEKYFSRWQVDEELEKYFKSI